MDYKYISIDEYKMNIAKRKTEYKSYINRVTDLWKGLIKCNLECYVVELENGKVDKGCILSFAIGAEYNWYLYVNRVIFYVFNDKNEISDIEVRSDYNNTKEKFDLIPKEILMDLINRISKNKCIRFTIDTISKTILIEKTFKEGSEMGEWITEEENII